MPVDLHLHSSVSDGTESPMRLMEHAAEVGLDAVALTDHDTLGGITEAAASAHRHGVDFVPGVELSVNHETHKLHLLVYFTEPGPGPLTDRLTGLLEGRAVRNDRIIERLNAMGYEITMDEVRRHAEGPSVGRPHIADALVATGAFADRDAAFEHLLHDGGPAYVERDRLSAVEAIGLAREQRCVPVVAHPVTIGLSADQSGSLFRDLANAGLGGLEAYHPMHSVSLRRHLAEVAHDLGIAATGGSDYHGTGKRRYEIGSGTGDLRVPHSALEELEAQRD